MRRTITTTAAKATTRGLRFHPLETLPDEPVDISKFRRSYFVPQLPVVLPRGKFKSLPAVRRWFSRSGSSIIQSLNYTYLQQYGDCQVPLELTSFSRSSSSPIDSSPTAPECKSFTHSYSPLSFFLQWTKLAEESPQCPRSDSSTSERRVYLAQCQLLDLPSALRDDLLPTPRLVSDTGKGDIYDTNIWLGLAPTYTPLHRDPNPNLFVQLAGRKCVRLCAPEIGMRVFTQVRKKVDGCHSGLRQEAVFRGEEMFHGLERELLEREVWNPLLFEHTENTSADEDEDAKKAYEVTLNAGDGLFIPMGWWHSLKGVGEGITGSVSESLSRHLSAMSIPTVHTCFAY